MDLETYQTENDIVYSEEQKEFFRGLLKSRGITPLDEDPIPNIESDYLGAFRVFYVIVIFSAVAGLFYLGFSLLGKTKDSVHLKRKDKKSE